MRRVGLSTAALALVIVISAAVLLQSNASAADRAAERAQAATSGPAASTPVAAVVPPAAQPQVEVEAVIPSAPVKPKPRSAEKQPPAKKPAAAKSTVAKRKTQRFTIAIGSRGYEPSVVRASAGRPIVLSVGRGEGCAAGFLMPELGVEKDNSKGPVTVNLGNVSAGRYRFSCGMEMVTGTLIVK